MTQSEAGLPREDIYVTNVVKHFKFTPTPKRRIHQRLETVEVGACRPWLEEELAVIRPEILVCLGATASKALLGSDFRLMKERGRILKTPLAPKLLATLHPLRKQFPKLGPSSGPSSASSGCGR